MPPRAPLADVVGDREAERLPVRVDRAREQHDSERPDLVRKYRVAVLENVSNEPESSDRQREADDHCGFVPQPPSATRRQRRRQPHDDHDGNAGQAIPLGAEREPQRETCEHELARLPCAHMAHQEEHPAGERGP